MDKDLKEFLKEFGNNVAICTTALCIIAMAQLFSCVRGG